MLTDKELQSLRNLGNEAEAAADEIARLVDKCNSYIVDNARLAEEVQRLRMLTFCGCGDQFTAHDPGTCGACVAGMTCAPGWNPGA